MIHVTLPDPEVTYSNAYVPFLEYLCHHLTKMDRDPFVRWCEENNPLVYDMVDKINKITSKYSKEDDEETRLARELLRAKTTRRNASIPITEDTSTP